MGIQVTGTNGYYNINKNLKANQTNANQFNQIFAESMNVSKTSSGNNNYYYGGSEDGCDDGKISTWSKVKNFFKGIGNTVVGAVKSLATPKGLLMAAGCIALCVATGGAAAPVLAGIGIAKGAINIGKSAYKASQATTDAEAEEAWQGIGGGTFEVAASAVAMKASVGAMKAAGNGSFTAGMKSSFNGSIAGKALAKSGLAKSYTASRELSGLSVKDSLKSVKEQAVGELKLGRKHLMDKAKTFDYKSAIAEGRKYISKGKKYVSNTTQEITDIVKALGVKEAIKYYGQEAVSKAVEYGKMGYDKYSTAAEMSQLTNGEFGTLLLANQA